MAAIIRQASREEREEFSLYFERVQCEGSGFSFPCDEGGNVLMGELGDMARASLQEARAAVGTVLHAPVVRRSVHRWRRSAILACDCGREVHLSGFTNACPCGRDYNASGSLLAPRAQWGEETGESLCDILRIR